MFNKIFFSILGAIALFGFVLPYLISAQSNELTMFGFFIIIVVLYGAGQYLIRAINSKEKE